MGLTFNDFSAANRERCESPEGFNHPIQSWSLSDWFVAMTGELGEGANIVKKLNRSRDGVRGNTVPDDALRAALVREVADVIIYADLIFQALGTDMVTAVTETFNAKSEQVGYPLRLPMMAPARATGFCANHKLPGGCPLHNLHCGYPECDLAPAPSAPHREGEADGK